MKQLISRKVLASKDAPEKNVRRIHAILNTALADLDDIYLKNEIDLSIEGPIKDTHDAIVAWVSKIFEQVSTEKEAFKQAKVLGAIIRKLRSPITRISKIQDDLEKYQDQITDILKSKGILDKKDDTEEDTNSDEIAEGTEEDTEDSDEKTKPRPVKENTKSDKKPPPSNIKKFNRDGPKPTDTRK